ncbi:unnamed protein product [Boreogadus saida]
MRLCVHRSVNGLLWGGGAAVVGREHCGPQRKDKPVWGQGVLLTKTVSRASVTDWFEEGIKVVLWVEQAVVLVMVMVMVVVVVVLVAVLALVVVEKLVLVVGA